MARTTVATRGRQDAGVATGGRKAVGKNAAQAAGGGTNEPSRTRAGRKSKGSRSYGTKLCPRCGEELFEDMDICYGCLYDFSWAERLEGGGGEAKHFAARESLPAGEPAWDEGLPPAELDGLEDMGVTLDLALPSKHRPAVDGDCLWVRSGDVEFVLPLPPGGILVGRGGDANVVLHSIAASRRHLFFGFDEDGLYAEDMGAKNPATLAGREIDSRTRVRPGQTVSVCGTLFTYLAPKNKPPRREKSWEPDVPF